MSDAYLHGSIPGKAPNFKRIIDGFDGRSEEVGPLSGSGIDMFSRSGPRQMPRIAVSMSFKGVWVSWDRWDRFVGIGEKILKDVECGWCSCLITRHPQFLIKLSDTSPV